MTYHIAVDIGASSGRLVLGMLEGSRIELKEIYRFENAIVEKEGRIFWDVDRLFEEILRGLQQAKAAGVEECTLGIDTWAVDYVLVDAEGKRLDDVYAYRDGRTKTAIADFQRKKSLGAVYQKTGIQFLSFNTLFQLYVHDREKLAKSHKILLIPDYLCFCFTGKYISEKTNASTTQLLNLENRDYDEELLHLVGVRREQFADLTEPGSIVGPVLETLRTKYNLPRCQLICVASHDTASAILGVPAVEEDFAYLSSGTWSLLGVENCEPITSEQAYRGNYTNEWGAYGTYRFLKNIMGLWLIQEVCRNLGKRHFFAELVQEAKAIKPFQFFIDCNHERFLKPQNMIKEIQNYCRESMQEIPQTAGELARCIFDSLALMYNKALREIVEISGRPIRCLHIVGGGAKNELLCQLTADVAQVVVTAGPVESTAIGNIVVQMISSGELGNIQEARKLIMASVGIQIYHPKKVDGLSEVYRKFEGLATRDL